MAKKDLQLKENNTVCKNKQGGNENLEYPLSIEF